MAKKRSCGCCCCIATIIILLLIGIGIAAFFLWARQPSINFQGVIPPANPQDAYVLQNAPNFSFNLRLNITVDNPNYVGVTLSTIDGVGKLLIDGEPQLGTGQMKDVVIARRSKTTILFPVEIVYDVTKDKDLSILKYLAAKCGLTGGQQRSKIQINYAVSTSVKVIAVSIDLPAYNGDVDFDCPIPPGTKIPGLDIILQAASGKLPANFDSQQLFQQAQAQIGKIDPSTIKNIQNFLGKSLAVVA